MRNLLITRRTVPLDRLEEYAESWARLCAAASAHGCQAWLFRRTDHEDRFIEFVEWPGASPLADDALGSALRELDMIGPPHDSDTWEETSLP